MFPVYFNALLKEDGSLTKNSDGSYSLVFTNVKNNVVLHQTWNSQTPTFNAKPFKVFSLSQSQIVTTCIEFNNSIKKSFNEEEQAGYLFTPTVSLKLNNKEYWLRVTDFKINISEEDPLKNGYTVTYTLVSELNTPPDNSTGEVNMEMTHIPFSIVKYTNPNEDFLKWMDMGSQLIGNFYQTYNLDLLNTEYNFYLENKVTISRLSNDNYNISITNPNVMLFYQIWNWLTPLQNKNKKRTTAYTPFSEFYKYFNGQREYVNALNINDKTGFYFNPAATMNIVKDDQNLLFLVQITSISLDESNLNEKSTFNMIVNTSKFDMYNSNLKIQLPIGTFDMSMNIDAAFILPTHATPVFPQNTAPVDSASLPNDPPSPSPPAPPATAPAPGDFTNSFWGIMAILLAPVGV